MQSRIEARPDQAPETAGRGVSCEGTQVTPLLDVLIPVYNGERWLRQSIASIQRQTHRALCIHVVDDGSSDATPHILATLAAADPRIRVHRQANAGIVDALNHGLAFCTAAFVARHDADDIAYPERLARQLDYLLANEDCVAVGAVARHIDADGHAPGSITVLRPPEDADARWLPAREPYLMHPFMLARRSALTAAGGYRHAMHAEDSDLYWRLREHGRLHNLPQVLGEYRQHGASVSAESVRNGRLMAVGSQLAALSARRRAAGQRDVALDPGLANRLRAADGLAALLRATQAELRPDEREHFGLAVGAKLLELADYQPYELEPGDCRVIGGLMRRRGSVEGDGLQPGNDRSLAALTTRTAVRLFQAGRHRDALSLLPAAWLPRFAARLALRIGVPVGVRHRLHGLLTRQHRQGALP